MCLKYKRFWLLPKYFLNYEFTVQAIRALYQLKNIQHSYLVFRKKGKKTRAPTVKVDTDQIHDLAVWCRDHAQSIFKLMDPEHNTKTKIDDDWDATYEYAKEIGMAFPDLQSLKKRMRRWRLILKGYRDDSQDTGTQYAFL